MQTWHRHFWLSGGAVSFLKTLLLILPEFHYFVFGYWEQDSVDNYYSINIKYVAIWLQSNQQQQQRKKAKFKCQQTRLDQSDVTLIVWIEFLIDWNGFLMILSVCTSACLLVCLVNSSVTTSRLLFYCLTICPQIIHSLPNKAPGARSHWPWWRWRFIKRLYLVIK